MYSESYTLLTTGIEGTCTLSDIDDQYYCGAASCSACEQYCRRDEVQQQLLPSPPIRGYPSACSRIASRTDM